MDLELWQWGLLMVAAVSIGMSKSGFSGVSLISIFILTELFGAKEQVGVALPMLIVADLIVFPAFLKHGNWREVWFLLPPTAVGAGIALFVLRGVDNEMRQSIVGAIILLMVAMQLARKWKPDDMHKLAMTTGFGLFAGVAGGLATMLANAAGPVQRLYLLSKKMEKMDLIGVGARFFLIVNLLKLPLLNGLNLVTEETLWINVIALPAIIIGVFGGKYLLKFISQEVFERLIVVFSIVAAAKLLLF